MEKSDLEKLAILLPHWVEHNEEHGVEFRKWAERAAAQGRTEIRDHILHAVEQMEAANASLRSALDRLEGDVA